LSTPQVSRLDKKNNFIQKAVKTIHKLKHNLSTTVKNILSGKVHTRQDFGFNTNSHHYRPLSYTTNVSRFHKKNNFLRNAAKSIYKSFNDFSTIAKNLISGKINRQDLGLNTNTVSILSGIAILVGWTAATAIDAFQNTPSESSEDWEPQDWHAAPLPTGVHVKWVPEEYSDDPVHIKKVTDQALFYDDTDRFKNKETKVDGDKNKFKPKPPDPP